MSWDNSRNTNVKRSHDLHCIVTNKLGDKDTRSFSMKTYKLIARGIQLLLENEWEEGAPTSARIIHDCDLALDTMCTVCQAGSIIVS